MALIGQDKVVPIPTATRHGCHFFRFLGGGWHFRLCLNSERMNTINWGAANSKLAKEETCLPRLALLSLQFYSIVYSAIITQSRCSL